MAWKKLECSKEFGEYLESYKAKNEGVKKKFSEEEFNEKLVNDYLNAFIEWGKREGNLINRVINRDSYNFVGEILKSYQPLKSNEEVKELVSRIERESLARENIDLPSTTLHTAGIFISYVVNEKYLRNEVELKINHPIDYLGLYTKKNWIIKGNVGNSLGRGMKGGKIKVEGDALTHVGEEMEDGVIEIDGDVSYYVGAGMKGGSIYLNGDFEGISASASGEIYHRGRRLGE